MMQALMPPIPIEIPDPEGEMDLPTLHAIGAFIQSLGQNPEIESELRSLGSTIEMQC